MIYTPRRGDEYPKAVHREVTSPRRELLLLFPCLLIIILSQNSSNPILFRDVGTSLERKRSKQKLSVPVGEICYLSWVWKVGVRRSFWYV